MKLNLFFKTPLITLVLCSFFMSCVKDLDFNQDKSLTISPVIEANIFNNEVAAALFTDDGTGQEIVGDDIDIEIFNEKFIIDNLIKAQFLFTVTNSINRAFQLKVDFFNKANALEHTFTFSIPNSSANKDIKVEHLEIFEDAALNALKATTKIIITTTLEPSTDGLGLNANSLGTFKIESKAILYLKINSSI